MSAKHPIIAVTGSSGAGTTSVMKTFEQIFRREGVNAAFVEGDSFHRFDRQSMKSLVQLLIKDIVAVFKFKKTPARSGKHHHRQARMTEDEQFHLPSQPT